jgi:hypothetical protein
MADNGLWAKLSCEEASDGRGGTDIKIVGSTRPTQENGLGTTTQVAGTLHANGQIEGEVAQSDNGAAELLARTDGTGFTSVPLPSDQTLADVAKSALEPVAKACKRALSSVPGVSG